MAISDGDFDAQLDAIVEVIRVGLEDRHASAFFTTVYLLHGDALTIQLLLPEERPEAWKTLKRLLAGRSSHPDSTSGGLDTYDLLYRFGCSQGRARPCPDAVFVAAEAGGQGGAEAIVLVGYTPDGRANAAELVVRREAEMSIRIAGATVTHLEDGHSIEWRRNGAQEVLRGFQDGISARSAV